MKGRIGPEEKFLETAEGSLRLRVSGQGVPGPIGLYPQGLAKPVYGIHEPSMAEKGDLSKLPPERPDKGIYCLSGIFQMKAHRYGEEIPWGPA
jgi:hypothetical protein